MIRDKMFVYNNLEPLNEKCITCSKKDHDIFFCPEIHYVPRKEFIIKKYLFSQPIVERNKITRFLRKKVNAKLLSKKLHQYEANNINENPLNEDVEEGTLENFSESELNNIPESPAIKTPDLRPRVSFENNLEIITKEKNEKIKNFDEDSEIKNENNANLHHFINANQNFNQEINNNTGFIGKKKTYESLELKITNNRRGSKFMMGKQPSLLNDNNTFQTSLSVANATEKHWEINFEMMQNYAKYFPYNNCDVLIKSYQLLIEKKLARIQKLKNIKKRRTIMYESSISPNKSRSKFGNESLALRKKNENLEEI